MDDRSFCANERFDGTFDQILTRLHEHLEPNIIWSALFFDEAPVEGVFGIGGRRKANFDFLEPALHESLEHLEFLADVHRHRERLVAVTQVNAAPDRGFSEGAAGPLPIGQADWNEPFV